MNANSNIVASALTSCVGSFSSNMAIDTKVSAENKVVYGFAIIFMVSMGLVVQASQGSDVPEALNTFLGNHCIDCHDDAEASGGLNIQSLDWNLDDPHITNIWVKIHDRIAAEEMPPEDASSLGEKERGVAIEDLAGRIQRFQEKNYAKYGRAVSRRVNRFEYENILRDLLHDPTLKVADQLPLDGEVHGFAKVGTALDVSHVQVNAYLDAAEFALRRALEFPVKNPNPSRIATMHARKLGCGPVKEILAGRDFLSRWRGSK